MISAVFLLFCLVRLSSPGAVPGTEDLGAWWKRQFFGPEYYGLLVAGGRLSQPRTRTYMALIGVGPEDDITWVCGGSLISPRYVLSAAHCSTTYRYGPARWARLGDLDHSLLTDDARVQDREIVSITNHPLYNPPENYHDITLFRLDREVDYNFWTGPVCLPNQQAIPSYSATLAGWGRVGFADATSSHLREADLDIIEDSQCRELKDKYSKDTRNKQGINTDIMLCAGKLDGSADGCSGDSGGPLVIEDHRSPCGFVQIGIASYGEMCSLPNSPGVYTRVSAYVPWIQEILKQDEGRFNLDQLLANQGFFL